MQRHGKYNNSVNPRGHGQWYLKVNCFVFFFFLNKLCNQKLLTKALVLGLA